MIDKALYKNKKTKPVKQAGVMNYLGTQEMVTAPKFWLSEPDHVKAKLAYITDEEEKNNLARLKPVMVEKAKSIFEKSRSDTDGFPYGGVIQDYKSMDRFEK